MKTRKRACDQHARIKQPHNERTRMIIAKRGGTGPADKLTPDPRTTANLKQKSRVVR
jgi:hypothetical protein